MLLIYFLLTVVPSVDIKSKKFKHTLLLGRPPAVCLLLSKFKYLIYSVGRYIHFVTTVKILKFYNTPWIDNTDTTKMLMLFFQSPSSKLFIELKLKKIQLQVLGDLKFINLYLHCNYSFHVRRGSFIFCLQKDFHCYKP